MATKDWNAAQYLKFEAERTRPVRDLLAQVQPLFSQSPPKRVVDLGCGPGNSTEVLVQHFPQTTTTVVGVDSSPDMIEKARKRLPGVEFSLGDLSSFPQSQSQSQSSPTTTAAQADLLFSNAVYQWLPYEERIPIFQRLIETLPSGGVFAFQVPDNFSEPSHTAMRSVASDPDAPWSSHTTTPPIFRKPFQSPRELYDALKPLCADLNIWHTHYYHILEDHPAIVEWVKGTGLRPYIDPLPSDDDRQEFLRRYLARIEEAYPPLGDGKVCLRYPRLFLVAVRA